MCVCVCVYVCVCVCVCMCVYVCVCLGRLHLLRGTCPIFLSNYYFNFGTAIRMQVGYRPGSSGLSACLTKCVCITKGCSTHNLSGTIARSGSLLETNRVSFIN